MKLSYLFLRFHISSEYLSDCLICEIASLSYHAFAKTLSIKLVSFDDLTMSTIVSNSTLSFHLVQTKSESFLALAHMELIMKLLG